MNRLISYIMALTIVIMVSCKNENSNPVDIPEGAFLACLGDLNDSNPSKIGNKNTPQTLLNDSYEIKWEAGDEIEVNKHIYKAALEGTGFSVKAVFSSDNPAVAENFYAFYPTKVQKEGDGNYDKGTATGSFTYDPTLINNNKNTRHLYLFAKCSSSSRVLRFTCISGILDIAIPEATGLNVSKIEIISDKKSDESDAYLYGDFNLSLTATEKDGTERYDMVIYQNGGKTMTITPPNGTYFTSNNHIYVPIPPQNIYKTLIVKLTATTSIFPVEGGGTSNELTRTATNVEVKNNTLYHVYLKNLN